MWTQDFEHVMGIKKGKEQNEKEDVEGKNEKGASRDFVCVAACI